MTTINCIIVDDEPIARGILETYIARTSELQLVKSCKSAAEAYEGLHEFKVDLIFLDIRMPVITGTDFLRSLRNPPMVIFTTAFADFAVEGFELNSVDYLLKPITYERFYQAVQKVWERKSFTLTETAVKTAVPDYIFIRQDSRLIRLNHHDILYIQAERDFSSVVTAGKKILAGMHLKMFESMLPPDKFIRVHRSFIVNLEKIAALQGNIVELAGKEIPIGANYKQHLLDRLGI